MSGKNNKITIGLPKFFTHRDVAELNYRRPASDQLERLEGGMLKHHCCFPKCDMFLKNLATDKDRVLNRRGGIFLLFR